jgi:replication-associated recombination protein RarA
MENQVIPASSHTANSMTFPIKHAPQTFDDLVIADARKRQRLEDYAKGNRDSNLMLHGPPGTGKSVAARVIAEARCGNPDLVEVFDGVDFTDETFDQILNRWQWQKINDVETPVVVIDEIDQMHAKELLRLRNFLSTHNSGVIIATTNNLHSLDDPLKDRFDVVELPAVDPTAWVDRAEAILAAEGVPYTRKIAERIVGTTNGSIRDTMRAIEDYVIATNTV